MLSFKNDLKLIMNTLGLSSYDLSNLLGFDVPTISNWLNDKYEPDSRSIEDIYEFAYRKGLRINEAHHKPLINSSIREGFKLLYHGSKSGIIGDISLSYCNDNNDFGKGFYLGETLEQSSMFVASYPNKKIYSFGLYMKDLNVYEFKIDLDWLLMIAYNRGRLDEFKESKKIKEILYKTKNVDVIIAPIADNRMFDIIDEFVNGMITDKACMFALAALDLGKQYVLRTDKAIKKLALIKEFYICYDEGAYYINKRKELNGQRLEKIKNFRQKNREGKYIDEIL